jgi:4-hydroxy-tetrahydrodipicolinate synthase
MGATDFGQVLTAMITPFNHDGAVDYVAVEKLVDHLIQNGTDTLVVCGTTGESPTLTWQEEFELFKVVKQAAQGQAKVVAGTGSNSTSEAIEATQKAAHLGLDGSLQVVPYYNKPPQAGLYHHFTAIAKSCPDLPIILYNIPGRTSCKLEPDTIAQLAALENIVAIKEATGNLDTASQIRSLTPTSFAIYSGDDSLTLPLLAVGAKGVVSVASHLVGNQMQEMISAFNQGQVKLATEIHIKLFPLFKALFYETNPIPLKTSLRLLGLDSGVVRSPLVKGTDQLTAKLKSVLEQLQILPVSTEPINTK